MNDRERESMQPCNLSVGVNKCELLLRDVGKRNGL